MVRPQKITYSLCLPLEENLKNILYNKWKERTHIFKVCNCDCVVCLMWSLNIVYHFFNTILSHLNKSSLQSALYNVHCLCNCTNKCTLYIWHDIKRWFKKLQMPGQLKWSNKKLIPQVLNTSSVRTAIFWFGNSNFKQFNIYWKYL